ncbi:MAG: hypothetical protein FWH36_01910 [Lentimicrobiaceae bacterium]|nr:hypothetical protein [Lentimicrobiaceae bacterium]
MNEHLNVREAAATKGCRAMEQRPFEKRVSSKDHTSRGNNVNFHKMKNVFLILISVIGFGFFANAQDVITLKNGDDIKALVQEIGDVDIKYKKIENPSGPNYTLKKSEILMIRYANGSKDIFSEEEKAIETKDVFNSESESPKNNESIETNKETVYLPENMQSRKDVIVQVGNIGFQTKITGVDNKHMFYIKFKKNGKEKDKKIKVKHVAYTLSFNEIAKQEIYPLRMNLQEFTSLPAYRGLYNTWVVFGTDGMSNLAHVRKIYPEIYDDYTKGKKMTITGTSLLTVSMIFVPFGGVLNPLWWAFYLPGAIIGGNGVSKINNSMTSYYANCVNSEILDKYGIVITPYKVNPLTEQLK